LGDGVNSTKNYSNLTYNIKSDNLKIDEDYNIMNLGYSEDLTNDFDYNTFYKEYSHWLSQRKDIDGFYSKKHAKDGIFIDDEPSGLFFLEHIDLFSKRRSFLKKLKLLRNQNTQDIYDSFILNFNDVLNTKNIENKVNKVKDTKINRIVRDSEP
jgi:hypothetical protein